MADSFGPLAFVSSLDNKDLRRQAEEAKRLFSGIGDQVEVESARIDASYRKIGNGLKGVLAGVSIGAFAKTMFQVRSEFQDAESAMTLFLGSAKKASQFMKELQDYAWYNAFEFSDLVNESKQLLAYGNDVESVIPILDQLSNVAIATRQPLSDLVSLYNKAKNIGKVDAMGLQTWGARGLVITDILKEMGVEVDSSAVKFEHLEMALNHVTAEGGMFHKQMEVMMPNLSMSFGQLQDEITVMFNELGEKSEGFMASSIDFASALVSNYERIGKIIVSLVTTYGAYRAAVLLVTAAEKLRYQATLAQMAGMTKMQAITDVLRVKTAALNKTLLANPYVLITTVVISAASAMLLFGDNTNYARESQKRLKDSLDEARTGAIAEQRELAKLKGELSALEKGSDEYNTVKNKIISNYGQYYAGLKDEIEAIGLTEAAYTKLTTAILDSFNARQYAQFAADQSDELDKVISKNLGKLQQRLDKEFGEELGAQYLTTIRNAIFAQEELPDDLKEALNKAQKIGEGIFADSRINDRMNAIRDAIKANEEFDKKARSRFGVSDGKGGPNDDKEAGGVIASIFGVDYEAAQKEWQEAKKVLKEIEADRNAFTTKQYEEARDREKDARESYQKLGGIIDPKKINSDAAQAKKYLQEYERIVLAAQEHLMSEQTKLAREEIENNLELSDHDRKIKLIEFDREETIKAVEELRNEAIKAWTKSGKSGEFDGFIFEDLIRQAKIKANVGIQRENDNRIVKEKKSLEELRKEFETYQDAILRIEDETQEKAKKLRKSGYEENAREAEKQGKAQISALVKREIEESGIWQQLFGDLGRISTETLSLLFAEAEKLITESTELSIEDIQILSDRLKQVSDEVARRNPFGTLKAAFIDYQKARESGDKDDIVSASNDMRKAIGEARNDVNEMNGALTGLLDSIGIKIPEAFTGVFDGMDEMLYGLETIDLTKPMSVVTGSMRTVSGLIKSVSSIFGGNHNKESKDTRQLEKVTKNIELTNSSINKLLERRVDLIKQATAAEAAYLNVLSQETIKQQKGYLEGQFDRLIGNEIFGKKGKNNNLTLRKLMEKEGLANIQDFTDWWNSGGVAKLTAEGYDIRNIESWEALVNNWDDLTEAAERADAAMKEAATGTTFDALQNGLDDLVKKADLAFDDIQESFEEHMSNAILNFVKKQILDDELQKWYDDFAEAMQSGNELTASETAQLQSEYESIIKKANEQYKDAMKIAGITLPNDSKDAQSATRKGFAAASQESIDELNGRFSAMQMILVEMKGLALISINHLANIEKNTNVLPAMYGYIVQIKKNTDNI